MTGTFVNVKEIPLILKAVAVKALPKYYFQCYFKPLFINIVPQCSSSDTEKTLSAGCQFFFFFVVS